MNTQTMQVPWRRKAKPSQTSQLRSLETWKLRKLNSFYTQMTSKIWTVTYLEASIWREHSKRRWCWWMGICSKEQLKMKILTILRANKFCRIPPKTAWNLLLKNSMIVATILSKMRTFLIIRKCSLRRTVHKIAKTELLKVIKSTFRAPNTLPSTCLKTLQVWLNKGCQSWKISL